MNKIIQEASKKCTIFFTKKTEEFLSGNINFDEEMEKWLLDFILILKEFIEKVLLVMDKEIEKDKNRKNDYYLEKRAVTKCVLHKIGVVEIKKIVKTLFIEADEDHVSLQKVRIVNGRSGNAAGPRLALIYENIEKTGKRVKKTEKHYISGLYKSSEKFWE
ncbi:hypothetical protein [Fusobacterium sp. PH5-44]|uniref:hypothetical protein n=1 Tax=unclassified Fusobacterium TaxID=2648384 RepID=UPI003D21E04B